LPENEPEFKNNVRNAFSKVKEDISNLKVDLESNKHLLNEIKKNISELNERLTFLNDFIKNKPQKEPIFFKTSIGNEGVFNDQQRSTMINDEQQSTTMNNNQQPSTMTSSKSVSNLLDPQFVKKIRDLTDREYSLFIKIYELNSLKEEISYSELANRLKLTEGTIRGVVTRIIAKGLPLIKERFFNKKSSLFIDPDFFKPFLLPDLMKLRASSIQKTLGDGFR